MKQAVVALLSLAALTAAVAQETPHPNTLPQEERGQENHRPRIGLVLSGGGARGTAHIGVLKVLEELRVPIDAIAGSSMGAVVGGLYASGLSAAEVERVMTSLDWQDAFRDRPPRADLTFRRKQEDQNFLVKFPLGLRGGRFLLPKGLIQGQKLQQTLRRLTLPVAQVERFDELPIPFRAVATDLETGEAVILEEGDLTTAMRASMSAPGVFAPVERDGRLLVDGGLSKNLPVDVAREMGVDVLIVVDVGFPLLKRERLGGVASISNQMLAIMVRRDSQQQRKSLGSADVIIDPALGEASSFDFGSVKRAIEKGEAAAREASTADRLLALAVTPEDYARHVARRGEAHTTPRIDFVRVEPGSKRYEAPLTALFGGFEGEALSADALDRRMTEYYGRGTLETLDYRLVREEERHGLELTARRNSWGPNYVRFGLNLQDDFEGNSSYNAATRFVLSEITAPGGEWVWDLQIGETPRIATELYLPLSQTSPYFFLPHARFEVRTVPVLDEERRIAEFRVRGFEYGLDFGREFGNWGELRTGLRKGSGSSRVLVGDPTLPTSRFDSGGFFVRFAYDKLNNVNFPRKGQSLTLQWDAGRTGLGDTQSSDRLNLDWLIARSRGRHTFVWWTTAGTVLDEGATVEDFFALGGFLNLSGVTPNSITGPHFGITRLIYYRQIGREGPGIFDLPVYAGLSFEAGNVWQRRGEAGFGSALKNGSLFLGVDTLLGPVYLAAGFGDGGQTGFYLFLGRTF